MHHVVPEKIEVGIGGAVDILAPGKEMQDAGPRQGDFHNPLGARLDELEILHMDRPGPAHAVIDFRQGGEMAALYEAGCRYIQLDETAFAKFEDPVILQCLKDRGDDWHDLVDLYLDVLNRVVADRPADLTVCVHMCRGNSRGYWQAEGGYQPVAERLFNEVAVDGFFLEYDSPRAGDFTPLREMPADKMVVLGLVSTKSGALESADHLKRRIEEAAGFVDLDQICISPQCGFASEHHGNPLTVEEEVAKLTLLVDVAREIWG